MVFMGGSRAGGARPVDDPVHERVRSEPGSAADGPSGGPAHAFMLQSSKARLASRPA